MSCSNMRMQINAKLYPMQKYFRVSNVHSSFLYTLLFLCVDHRKSHKQLELKIPGRRRFDAVSALINAK